MAKICYLIDAMIWEIVWVKQFVYQYMLSIIELGKDDTVLFTIWSE